MSSSFRIASEPSAVSTVVDVGSTVKDESISIVSWIFSRPFARRRQRLLREAMDVESIEQAMADVEKLQGLLRGQKHASLTKGSIDGVESYALRYEDDPHAAIYERIEEAVLGIRSRKHWFIRDMMENLVLHASHRNEYFVHCLASRMRDVIDSHDNRT